MPSVFLIILGKKKDLKDEDIQVVLAIAHLGDQPSSVK